MSSKSENPRLDVLIVSAQVGTGHVQAARAVEAELRRVAPQLRMRHIDVLDYFQRWYRLLYASGFKVLMSRLGWVYGAGFWLSNRRTRPGRSMVERFRLWFERGCLWRFRRFVERVRPRLIVNTHIIAPPIVGRLIEGGYVDSRQFVCVTDTFPHRWWYSEHVERYFVAHAAAIDTLRSWGIDRERIVVSGIPVLGKWDEPVDPERVRREWDLPRDRKIVLVSGGAAFTCGPVARIARRLVEACPDIFVVVLAGHNKSLLARLCRMDDVHDRLRAIGYTDRLPELVETASLFVTKAGGITTSECLGKGTPMVLLRPVPGQESDNARHFERHGAAVIAHDTPRTVAQVRRLLADPDALAAMGRAARSLSEPGRQTLAREVCRALGVTPRDAAAREDREHKEPPCTPTPTAD